MTKDQIKYYHLLKEIVEIKESNRLVHDELGLDFKSEDVRKANDNNFKILENPDNAMKIGESNANTKRFKEINIILQEEYQMKRKTGFLLELTRDKLPKHMILPDGNYLKIEYQGITYPNSPSQAYFIEQAYQLLLDGSKTFNAPEILIKMQLKDSRYTNITELFKGNPINGSLIIKERIRGIYKLDIEI